MRVTEANGGKQSRLILPVVVLAIAVAFVGWAAWQRYGGGGMSQSDKPTADSTTGDTVGGVPVDQVTSSFELALLDEAEAYQTTCSLCHDPPNPKLYDAAGWEGIGRKMKEHMAERMDVAIHYLQRNARPTIRFEPLARLDAVPAAPASQPATRPE